jgi:hypothetical protein
VKNDSLLYFNSPKGFLEFTDSLNIYKGWKIYSGKMNKRGEMIRDRPYAVQLRELFSQKQMFRKQVSVAEIVSWLDNFLYMRRFLSHLEVAIGTKLFKQTEVFVEYKIKMSKMMRIDYVLQYNDNILLLEFRTLDGFNKIRSTWSKKKTELLIYKELMQNYLLDARYLTYAFIGLYEYENSSPVPKHIDHNKKQIEYLTKYLRIFMYGFSE